MTTSDAPPKGPGLKVATLGGVPVFLGWSWFLLAAVITVSFGSQLAAQTSWGYAIGVGYAVTLLVAVMLHEGAHALTARGFGISVHRVVADFMGGHTAFDARGLTPGRSAAIAAAGPLANAGLGAVAWLGQGMVTEPVTQLVLAGVAWINLLLAVFNFLPGLPLDGGQLVEALVWGVTGRRASGLIAAGWCGRILAVGIGFWVLVRPLLAGATPSTFSLIWGVLLGSVIWRGASAAIARGRYLASVDGVTLGEVSQRAVELATHLPIDAAQQAPGVVVARAEDGRPTLVLAGPAANAAYPAGTPLSAGLMRLPDAAVIEAGPQEPVDVALRALAGGELPLAVLTEQGQVWGVTSLESIVTRLAAREGRAPTAGPLR